MSEIVTCTLASGATLLVEPIDSVASAALSWLVPAGTATDAPEEDGIAAMLSEAIFRGAGGRTSREHSDALDREGAQRSSHVLGHHLQVGATMLGARFDAVAPLVADMIHRPALGDDALEPVRSLCLQSLESLNDDPAHRVMLELRRQHVPAPFNRHGYGEAKVLERLTMDDLRRACSTRFVPEGSIIAVAGAVDPARVRARLDEVLEGWRGTSAEPRETAEASRGYRHETQDTAQVHLGIAWDAPPEAHDDSMLERVAISVLGGSTSGRLFTEVRQKRSLCYSVGASYRAGRDRGRVGIYAGTTPERAQETLDVCLAEIERLVEGVTPAEFDRAVIGLKSNLVMQGEATPARAASLAADHFRLGRARTLDDVARAIDAVTPDALAAYLRDRRPGPFTVVSIGPEPLEPKSLEPLTFPSPVGVMPKP